jgi:hypothetical protein
VTFLSKPAFFTNDADDSLATVVDMDMLDADVLSAAAPQSPVSPPRPQT